MFFFDHILLILLFFLFISPSRYGLHERNKLPWYHRLRGFSRCWRRKPSLRISATSWSKSMSRSLLVFFLDMISKVRKSSCCFLLLFLLFYLRSLIPSLLVVVSIIYLVNLVCWKPFVADMLLLSFLFVDLRPRLGLIWSLLSSFILTS